MKPEDIQALFERFKKSLDGYLASPLIGDEHFRTLIAVVLNNLAKRSPVHLWTGELSQSFHEQIGLSENPHLSAEIARLVVMLKNDCGVELYEELCEHILFSTDFTGNSEFSHTPALWKLFSLKTEINEAVSIRQQKPVQVRKGLFWKSQSKTKEVDVKQVAKIYLRNNPHIVFIYMLMMSFVPKIEH